MFLLFGRVSSVWPSCFFVDHASLLAILLLLAMRRYPHLYNDLPGSAGSTGSTFAREPTNSVVVMRDASHPNNLSGGPEMYVPPRLLYGVVPHCLLEAYDFYQDETSKGDMRGNGTRKIRGYPKDEDATRTIVFVDFGAIGAWSMEGKRGGDVQHRIDITGVPGRSVRVLRRGKHNVEKEFKQLSLLASIIESAQLLSVNKGHRVHEEGSLDDFFTFGGGEEDDEELPKFEEGEAILCFEDLYSQKWCSAYIGKVKEDDLYDVQFNDDECYEEREDVSATKMRKIPKGKSIQDLKGEGIWRYASMSDSEKEDWASDEEDGSGFANNDRHNPKEKTKRVRSKKKLTFSQFWQLPSLFAAATGATGATEAMVGAPVCAICTGYLSGPPSWWCVCQERRRRRV